MKKCLALAPRAVMFATLILAFSLPLFAQKAACVYLEPGAGYAAWMRVVSGDWSSDWSSSFPIGQYRCKSLESIGDGQPYTVQVSAVLGSSKVPCQPSNLKRVASSDATVTFNAWGTTLSVKCQMPSLDGASAARSVTPSKEGLAAAEKIKKGDIKPPAK